MTQPSISVIYPAYNEAAVIRDTIGRSVAALDAQFDDFELIIVDDRGSDDTGEIAAELAASDPRIRVVVNPYNLGQGASIIAGFQHARKEWLLHNGMDYPFDLNDIAKMRPYMSSSDVITASRLGRPGYSLYRHVLSRVNLMLLHLLFPLRLPDYNFVQLYRREVWESLRLRARSTGFLTPEAILRAYDLGYRIQPVACEYYPRLQGTATAGSFRVVRSSFEEMMRFWWERTFDSKRPVRKAA